MDGDVYNYYIATSYFDHDTVQLTFKLIITPLSHQRLQESFDSGYKITMHLAPYILYNYLKL